MELNFEHNPNHKRFTMAAQHVSIPKPQCQLCEIVYDRNEHVPHVFPCQHTLCSSCLHARIENCTDLKSQDQQLHCPFCSQTTALNDTLPVNRALLDMLDLMQDIPNQDTPKIKGRQGQGHRVKPAMTSHDDHQKDVMCLKHPGSIACALCMQCMKGVCVTCLIEAKEHAGHEVLEFRQAVNKCMERSQTTVQEIILSCTAINNSITKKAQAKNLDCFTLLQKIKNINAEVTAILQADSTDQPDARRDFVPACDASSTPDPEEQGIASDSLPMQNNQAEQVTEEKASPDLPKDARFLQLSTPKYLPQGISINPKSVTTKIASFLASAQLPDYKHVDVNQRNKLLLVFPNDKHAIYKIDGSGFSKMSIPTLCEKSSCALKEADHVLLSDENEIVIPSESFVMQDNSCKVHYIFKRYLSSILCVAGKWFICAFKGRSTTGNQELCTVIGNMGIHKSAIYNFNKCLYECKLDSEYICMVRDELSGFVFYSDGAVKIPTLSSCNEHRYSCQTVKLLPVPKTVISGTVVGDKVLIIEKKKQNNISVYIMEERWKEDERNVQHYNRYQQFPQIAADNKVTSISVNDLGLSEHCEIVRIWSGDTPQCQRILHVLYKFSSVQHQEGINKISGHQQSQSLASYTLSQDFLNLK